jgi:GT2 family glycosyltransferase
MSIVPTETLGRDPAAATSSGAHIEGAEWMSESLGGWIDYAAWLGDSVLVLVGWFPRPGEEVEFHLVRDGRDEPVQACFASYARSDPTPQDPRPGKVVALRVERPLEAGPDLGRLTVRSDGRAVSLGPSDVSKSMTSLESLLLGGLAPLPAADRARLVAFLAAAPTRLGLAVGIETSRALATARDLVCAAPEPVVIASTEPRGLHVDEIFAIDSRTFFVRGWLHDREGRVTDLTLVSPEGHHVRVLDAAYLVSRPDVEKFYEDGGGDQATSTGFCARFQTEGASRIPSGWRIEMANVEGDRVVAPVPPVIREPGRVRSAILRQLAGEVRPDERLLRDHLAPALDQLQARLMDEVGIAGITEYGVIPESPDVSIVVPLYRRLEFMEAQLAQFVHDPEMREVDLVYVLDSPEQADDLAISAPQLHELYGIPFRVVTLDRNGGFSAANNLGASVAVGRLLLLLNSDVLPDRPGWLGTMKAFFDQTPDIGALGPKLLYEDDTLQHAGMYFDRQAGHRVWQNLHYFKGMPRSLPGANLARRVPAVTGAAMLMERARYEDMGGLRGRYVQGDFEDSDLCLRLFERGLASWYLPTAELYHLEGQSYPSAARSLNTRFNAWLHTHLWDETIQEVRARFPYEAMAGGACLPNETMAHEAVAEERAVRTGEDRGTGEMWGGA